MKCGIEYNGKHKEFTPDLVALRAYCLRLIEAGISIDNIFIAIDR